MAGKRVDLHRNVIESLFGEVYDANSRSGEYKVMCPACSTKAMFCNTKKHVYYCFSCGSRGRMDELIPNYTSLFNVMAGVPTDILERRHIAPPVSGLTVLPPSFKRVTSRSMYPVGWDYMIKRGVNPTSVEWGYYEDTSVCFPLREARGGNVVYWQSRTVCDFIKRKTSNPSNASTGGGKSNYIYRTTWGNESHERVVVLVEGVFDALRVQGTATLGKQVSEVQRDKIFSLLQPYAVFVCYDGDAYEQTEVATKYLRAGTFTPVIPVRLPDDKDPADLGPEELYMNVIIPRLAAAQVYLSVGGVDVSWLATTLREKLQVALQTLPL